MVSNIDEVLSDFKKSLSEINFSAYNPNSAEFQNALNIGLMWLLLCEIYEAKAAPAAEAAKPEENDEISDELYGAKKYFQKYLNSNDVNFKNMAKDELKHAEILIKKANAKLPSGNEKTKLKKYETELRQISAELMK